MLHDIKQIKKLCGAYRTEPKILLIPGRSMKTQVLKTLADHGVCPLNLTVKTIKELSYDIAENSIINDRLTVIDFREITEVMTDLLKMLRTRGALCFFDRIEVTFGICKAISKTVLELLDSGYSDGNVNLNRIENEKKRNDLKIVIKEYTIWKKVNHYIDHTDVAQIALALMAKNGPGYTAGYALEACEFSFWEGKILDRLHIQTGTVGASFEHDLKSNINSQAKRVKFFEAYGDYNEVKEVIRTIVHERIPFDNVLIVAPVSEPYSQLCHQLIQQYTYAGGASARRNEFPVTFGTGLPLILSSPAKLLMLLLDWVGSGYRSHEFINIFSSGVFDIKKCQRDKDGNLPEPEERFNKLNIINVIKNAGLTWQRRSYRPCFEKYLAFLTERNRDDGIAGKAARWLIEFAAEAFEKIPEADESGAVDVEIFLNSLKSIVDKYNRIFSAFDSHGLRVTLHELNTSIKGRRVKLNEAVEIIKDHMRDVRILNESPAPGRMHFTTYRQASWIERNNVFVIGLGADNFPGTAMEDPLLLDDERMAPMMTSVDRINKNISIMNAFIENIKGGLTCSHSCFDTVDIRECYPSIFYYRIKEQFPEEEIYHTGFVLDREARFIDENDYWIYQGVKNGAAVYDECREAELFDKPLWPASEQMAEQVLSATSLLDYLECRYKYFLKHVLHLKEIRTDEFDALGWLSALETGNLYHKIFELFILHVIEKPGILSNKSKAIKLITNIAGDEIAKFEEELPTASDFHTERQRNEILSNAVKFAEYEIKETHKRKAAFAELKFGEREPVIIDLGEGRKLKASGIIDRIDKLSDGSVEIIDYKTGRARAYWRLRIPLNVGIDEANAQLALYYLALKTIARGSDYPAVKNIDDISKLSYRFVTAKGNYDIISLPTDNGSEDSYKAAFLEIFKEIEEGIFPPLKGKLSDVYRVGNKVDCRYCGYNNACQYAFADEE